MSRILLLFLVGVLATCAAGAPAPPPSSWQQGWDKPVVPDKDCCKFRYSGNTLTIEVAGKKGVSETDRPLLRSPRLLRDVSGDFVAEVRLSGRFIPSEGPEKENRGPRVYAGLVLVGEKDWIACVERNTIRKSGEARTELIAWLPTTFTNVVREERAKLVGLSSDQEAYLRLSRKGNAFSAAFSTDGKKWEEVTPENSLVSAKLKVGVFAASTSKNPFKPRFDKFKLDLKGPKGR
jgi:regulation of enolase protein 1 (concanavalin A-like superfamily)